VTKAVGVRRHETLKTHVENFGLDRSGGLAEIPVLDGQPSIDDLLTGPDDVPGPDPSAADHRR
jgi:hypothetical protein